MKNVSDWEKKTNGAYSVRRFSEVKKEIPVKISGQPISRRRRHELET
jgi:hypothetical protein